MRKLFAAAALGVIALAACSDNDPTGPIIVDPVENNGRVRVVHGVTDVASMDVLFGSTMRKAGLAFGADYWEVIPAAATTVKVRKAGANDDLVKVELDVEKQTGYTILTFGSAAAPQSVVLTDGLAAPAAGKVKVRVAHAAASRGALDVYILAAAGDLATATPASADLALEAASEYIAKDPGSYVVILTEKGKKDALLTLTGVKLEASRGVTIAIVEKAGEGKPLAGVILTDR